MQTIENFQLNQSTFISNSNMCDQTHNDFQRIAFKRNKFYSKAFKAIKPSTLNISLIPISKKNKFEHLGSNTSQQQ